MVSYTKTPVKPAFLCMKHQNQFFIKLACLSGSKV